jgi:glycosyltransferase involved in cell wall biosynthesis
MKIALDATGAAKPKRTGVGRYIESLVDGLLRLEPPHELLLAVRLSRWRRRRHFLRPDSRRVRVRLFQEPFTGRIRRFADVFHGPDLRLPRLRGVPLVATVHDAFSLTSEVFAREEFRRRRVALYREAFARADRIVTPSRASRDRLCEGLDVPEDRIRVVPLGVDDRFRVEDPAVAGEVRERHGLPERYVLHVGQVSRRKNLPRLIAAFGSVAGDRPELGLILAGRLSYGAEETLEARDASPYRDRVLLTDHFPDADLPGLYAAASVVVLPSLDEGFGLTVAEGMAAGVPVVASSAGAIPEVAGDAALLVDPEDEDALAVALARALDDDALRGDLVTRGRRRVEDLSWSRCAERTAAVYEEVLRSRA